MFYLKIQIGHANDCVEASTRVIQCGHELVEIENFTWQEREDLLGYLYKRAKRYKRLVEHAKSMES